MLRKLFVFILLSLSICASVFAQNAPVEPKKPAETYRALIAGFPGSGSFLGVQTRDVSKENMAQFGLREVRGVAIEKVSENSPAETAGLMNGDVIVKFNGEEVTSVRKLTRLISEVAPDHTAKITVLRSGAERDFDVTLGKRETPQLFDGNFKLENLPPMPAMPKGEFPAFKQFPALPPMKEGELKGFLRTTGANRQIGINAASLTRQLGDYFGVEEGRGLLINSVRENSPAAKAGLRAGDIIIEVEGKEVKNNLDLIRAINEKKEGDISLTIIRDRNRQTISVTPEVSKTGVIGFDGDLEQLFELAPEMKLRMSTPLPPRSPRISPLNLENLYTPGILE